MYNRRGWGRERQVDRRIDRQAEEEREEESEREGEKERAREREEEGLLDPVSRRFLEVIFKIKERERGGGSVFEGLLDGGGGKRLLDRGREFTNGVPLLTILACKNIYTGFFVFVGHLVSENLEKERGRERERERERERMGGRKREERERERVKEKCILKGRSALEREKERGREREGRKHTSSMTAEESFAHNRPARPTAPTGSSSSI